MRIIIEVVEDHIPELPDKVIRQILDMPGPILDLEKIAAEVGRLQAEVAEATIKALQAR